MKDENQNRVKDGVDHGAQGHREHGIFGAAVGPDHRVDGAGDHHKGQADADDGAVLQGIGPQHIGGAEEIQDGVDADEEYCGQKNAHHGHQDNGVADALFGAFNVALAQLQAQIGGAAVPDHQGEGKGHNGDGEDDVGSAVAQIAHAPANEDLVHDVVKGIHQQGDDAGNGEFCNQPPDGFGGKNAAGWRFGLFHVYTLLLFQNGFISN